MTGPDHYREAERLLDGYMRGELTGAVCEIAQVHATLALAAATALAGRYGDVGAWGEAAGARTIQAGSGGELS